MKIVLRLLKSGGRYACEDCTTQRAKRYFQSYCPILSFTGDFSEQVIVIKVFTT